MYNGKDIYKQLESCMAEIEKLKEKNKELQKKYDEEVKKHNEDVARLTAIIGSQQVEIDRLKKNLNNNSQNSSLPPSTDIKPNNKEIPNNREKTNKKVGGQKGHKGHNLSKKEIEDKIKNNEIEHEVINVGKASKSKRYISKYVIDVKISVCAKEYRFYPDTKGKYAIPKEFQTDVQYGNNLKALCTFLNIEGLVPFNRLAYFVNSITKNKLNISNGTLVNFNKEFGKKTQCILNDIETGVLNSLVMNTDATTSRCCNKNTCVRTYSTDDYTLLKATKSKSKKSIEASNVLNRYQGNLCHDHETVIYNYGRNHAECNVHILRYLKGNFECTHNMWCKHMASFLVSLNEYRKRLLHNGIKNIDAEHLERYSKRYDEILNNALEENKNVSSRCYKREEKALINRLIKYKENHLLFLYDFDIPFDNNMAERDLRHVKSKQKVSGCFRSNNGQKNYLDIKSVFLTLKKQSKDIFTTITKIFTETPVKI